MRKNIFQKVAIAASVALIISFTSCKKDKVKKEEVVEVPVIPTTGTRTELTKDSIFLYAKQTYYWNTTLPEYNVFQPRKYASFDDELVAITQYSNNPATGKPYEYSTSNPTSPKYSFIDDGSVSTQLSGTGGDYGFSVFYNSSSDLRVKYVYAGSSAATQGVKRGYQITKINGRTDLVSTSSANIDFVVNAIFGSNATVTLTVKKPDGTSQDVTVTRGNYVLNPILYNSVYTVGAKKVGYIVFNSFTTNSTNGLQQTFANMATQGVTELIVDLRYNGGGSVQTATDLSNLLVPASQNGKVMFTTYFNQTMQSGQATILKNQKFYYQNTLHSYFEIDYKPTVDAGNQELFTKSGSLSLTRVYFLVTGGTASASELTINNLKPVMDVKLIGKQTYGKPVGFFAIHIDKFDMYIPQFETKNQAGVGGYYSGLPVDVTLNDDVTKEFGDPTESYLASALYYATNGRFSSVNPSNPTVSSTKQQTDLTSAELDKLTADLGKHDFKGMVETSSKFKK